MAEWQRVSVCETGGDWSSDGPIYAGGIGISRINWAKFSTGLNVPANAAQASEQQQIEVAEAIEAAGGVAGYVPDQDGECRAW